MQTGAILSLRVRTIPRNGEQRYCLTTQATAFRHLIPTNACHVSSEIFYEGGHLCSSPFYLLYPMKPALKKKVFLFIAALGLFISAMGIGLVYGVDHPRPNDKRGPVEQASRRSMGSTVTWAGIALTFGSLGLLMMGRNSEKRV
jgi:hypothetical protein